MPLVLADRVNETTTTTSTGTVTLAGAVSGYQSFAVIGNANTTYYTIVHQTASEWEVGIGTYTSSGTTLSRDTVLASSNSGSLVNFSAGTKFVFCDYPAGRAVYLDTATNVTIPGLTLSGGTANGVLYLNGSKVATSGTALVFDGTNLSGTGSIGTTIASKTAQFDAAGGSIYASFADGTKTWRFGAGIISAGTVSLYNVTNAVTAFTVDATGNLGIGTSSPGTKLDVVGTIQSNGVFSVNGTTTGDAAKVWFGSDGSGGGFINVPTSKGLAVYQNNATNLLTLTSSGNLGLGVTPSAWSGVGAALQVGTSAAIIGNSVSSSSFISNAYFDGTNYRYIGTGFAMRLALTSGAYAFTTAASGTAGNTISFTQAMTLTAAGILCVGATSNTSRGGGNTTLLTYKASGTNYLDIQCGSSGDSGLLFSTASSGNYGLIVYSNSVGVLQFYTTSTERMRLDGSGNLGIGTTSPGQKLTVNGGLASIGPISALTASSTFFDYNTTLNSGRFAVVGNTTGTAAPIVFSQYSSNGSVGRDAVTINSSGNLGIGTTSPVEKLDVVGNCRISSGSSFYWGDATSQIVADNGGAMRFLTGTAAERMRITSDGKVGIASTNPGVDLQIGSDTSTTRALSVRYSSVPLYLSGGFDGTNALNTFSANAYANATGSGQSWTSFSNTSYAASAVQLASSTTGADIRFLTAAAANTNPTERARFNATGAFVFAGGTTTADGIGITFPATQSASTNANTLDDYEEGTFDPTITCDNTAPTGVAYTSRLGRYTKIGRVVYIQLAIALSNKGTGGTGFVVIGNLPFTTASDNTFANFGALIDSLASDLRQVSVQSYPNQPFAYLIQGGGSTGSHNGMALADITNSTQIRVGFFYTV